MPKEPGEKSSENFPEQTEKSQKMAEVFLYDFDRVLNDVESEKIVDLNRVSNTHRRLKTDSLENDKEQVGSKTASMSQAEALKTTLERLKMYIGYLDPEEKHLAEGLIMKAELYLATHQPKKEK